MADRRVKVVLEAQVDQYKRGMDQAAQATDRVSQSTEKLGSSTSGLSGVRSSFAEFGETMRGIQRETPQFAAGLAGIGAAMTGVTGVLVKTGIEYNTLQQVAGRAMETMTDSAQDAALQMERLHEFADTSPFGRDTWIEAQQQLMAFGVEAERVVPTLEGVQNAVAAIGGGDQEIRRLVEILGQIEGQGKITGRELQRMGQMGINAADIIGEAMGVSGNEIREQITAGTLDAETAITALTDGMNVRFAGAAEGLRDTMEGSLDRIRARIRDIGSVLAAPLVSPDGGGFLVDAMNMAADFGVKLLELPDIVLQVSGGIVAATGGIAMAGATWMMIGDQIAKFATGAWNALVAVKDLGGGLVEAAGGFRRVGAAAGIAAAGIALIAATDWATEQFLPDPMELDDVARALRNLAQTGEYAGGIQDFGLAFEELNSTGGKLREAVPTWAAALMQGFGAGSSSAALASKNAKNLAAEFEHTDEAISGFIQGGNMDAAAAGIAMVSEQMLDADLSIKDVVAALPEVSGALIDAAQAAGINADAHQIMELATSAAALEALAAGESWSVINRAYEEGEYVAGLAAGEVLSLSGALSEQAEMANAAAEGISNLVEDMNAYSGVALSAEETTDNWLASLRELNENLEDGTYSLDKNTDSGKENRAELRGIAADALEAAAATATQTESLEETNAVVDDAIEALRSAGEAAELSESEIDDMIRTYMGFNDVEPIEVQAENRAKEIFDEVEAQLFDLPDDWEIRISALADDAQEVINAIVEGDHEAVVDILGDDAIARDVITAFADGDYEAVARIMADPMEANRVVMEFENGEYVAVADVNGNTSPADQAMAAFLNGDYGTVADIAGNDAEARATILRFLNGDYETTADIHGNDSSARGMMSSFVNTPWSTDVRADAHTWNAESDLTHTARDRSSTVTATARTWDAETALNNVARARSSAITITRNIIESVTQAKATGGAVYGPGSGTSDSIPALLSNGEHVLTAREVQAMGGQRAVYEFRANLASGPSGRDMRPAYAAGGAVQARQIGDAVLSGVGGMAGVSIGEITAVGGDTDQVVNRVGDEIFRRLRQEGVPVGSF